MAYDALFILIYLFDYYGIFPIRSLSLSPIPIFPAISFIFSLINNSSQFVLGLISSFREFSSECFLPGEIRIGFHFF